MSVEPLFSCFLSNTNTATQADYIRAQPLGSHGMEMSQTDLCELAELFDGVDGALRDTRLVELNPLQGSTFVLISR